MRGSDGLTKEQRYSRRPADTVICPVCKVPWRRNQQQRMDHVRYHKACVPKRFKGMSSRLRATIDVVATYKGLIGARLELEGTQARDVEVNAVLRLMLEARKDGIRVGRDRAMARVAAKRQAA